MIALFLVAITFRVVCSTDKPIIGILTQELDRDLKIHFDANVYTSYLAASYVKYFESCGARVIPIPLRQNQEYYRNLVSHVNGIVLPGGKAKLDDPDGYGSSGRLLLTALEEAARNGKPIPTLGVCLGMELMAWHDYKKMYDVEGESRRRVVPDGPLVFCKTLNINLRLKYLSNPKQSAIFKRATSEHIENLQNRAMTAHNHQFCVTEASLRSAGIKSEWEIIAHSQNRFGMDFVSVMQSPRRLFYAIQFHPEKSAFEWSFRNVYPHDPETVNTNRVFGDSFVDMCRQNDNVFPLYLERQRLIYAFSPVDSGRLGLEYEQIYLFRSHDFH